jgi:nitrite reductase/ring-hydroxylating ferredoxin subunit
MRVVVGRVRDFGPGERRITEAGRHSIGVFRVGDRFYAISNHCPHQGGPLCLGRTAPWVVSGGPGEFRQSGEHALLACPWHGWEYDLATGQSFLGPGEAPARGYEVSVKTAEALRADPGVRYAGRIPGPYVAETFPVQVTDEYVVVDTRSHARNGQPGDGRVRGEHAQRTTRKGG